MQRIDKLCESDNVRKIELGKTITGRPIPAYLIGDFSTSSLSKPRILVISGQHGDEINPIQSVLSFSENLASGAYPDVLGKNLVMFIPVVNPDGLYATRRFNSLGRDINRSWQERDTSENEFVHSMVRIFSPQLIIDAHEWLSVPDMPGDGVEVAWTPNHKQRQAMIFMGEKIAGATGLKQIRCTEHANATLFHRRYSRLGYGSFLIETDPKLSPQQKDKAYKSALLTAINHIGANKGLRANISPSATSWKAQELEAVVGSLRGRLAVAKKTNGWLWSIGPFILLYLLLLYFKPKRRKQTLLRQWKPRRDVQRLREHSPSGYSYRTK